MQLSKSHRLTEIVLVLVTGLGKILFFDVLNQKFIFIVLAILGWLGYITYQVKRQNKLLSYWGFTKTNFWKSFSILGLFSLISIPLFLGYGWYNNSIVFNWHLLLAFLVYPLWGVIQQFLIMALFAGNLNDGAFNFSKPIIVVVTALLFGVIHFPYGWLVLGTFILALVYTPLYLKYRNIWVLGLFHGWLGACFYFLALGRDVITEMGLGF